MEPALVTRSRASSAQEAIGPTPRRRYVGGPVIAVVAVAGVTLIAAHAYAFLRLDSGVSYRSGFAGASTPSLRRPGLALLSSSGKLKRMAEAMEKWKVGPAEIYSGPAQKAMYLLKEKFELFEPTFEEELEKLSDQKEKSAQEDAQAESSVSESDAIVLRRRVKEVREAERVRTAMELIYLKVCSYFIKMQVPLIPPLKGGGAVDFGQRISNLNALTDIYSQDALGLVRDHLFGILGVQAGGPFPKLVHIALFQAGQVYAMSSLFGYYVRRVDARFQLEKLAGSFGEFGNDSPVGGSSPFPADDADVKTLKDYVSKFGPEELARMTAIASVEAQNAMETQVTALFGDLRVLKDKLLEAVGMVMSNEEAAEKLRVAIKAGEVESIHINTDDFRRLVLEAVAFGALLYDAEKQADSLYELKPASSMRMGALGGDDDMEGGRMLPG